MNYAESFEQFATKLSTMDLVLYAGAGIVIYVLFKEKLGPIKDLVNKLYQTVSAKTSDIVPQSIVTMPTVNKDKIFFELVSSWKKTRDLASQSNCSEAVKVADQMFPFLSPTGCDKSGEEL